MKNIVIIGSSGGNLFNLGGAKPVQLLEEILKQAQAAGLNVANIQFIAAKESMDTAKDHTDAAIYGYKENEVLPLFKASLKEVNLEAVKLDRMIAESIRIGEVDGIIAMSADTKAVNKETIAAAIERKLPIVGTGGTSMAAMTSMGANVISSSGTTGSTSRTRSISFISSLCKHWNIKFNPVIGSYEHKSAANIAPWKNINIRGIMVSSLPGFIAMALILAFSQIPGLKGLSDIFDLMINALPVMLAVIAAKQVSELDEVSIIAGVIAGILSVQGGIIGGIIGGIAAGLLVQFFFRKCIEWKFPITTVNIVSGGLSGVIAGLFVYYLIGPVALQAGNLIKEIIEQAVAFNPILAGVLAGILIWPAILGGVYHAAILPIVLLEMEKTGNSFLGAVDMVGLVMVAAGINLANIVAPKDRGESAVAAPGFLINMGFGTFVESAYPFMFSNKIVFGGALVSAGIGGGLVGLFDVRGTAYVPSFTAPFLSNNITGFIIAMVVPLVVAFLITLAANKLPSKKKTMKKSEDEVAV